MPPSKEKKQKSRKVTDMFSAPFLWFLLTICMFTVTSYAFVIFQDVDLFSSERHAAAFFDNYFINNQLLVFHIALAAPAAVIGPFLFHTELRNNNLWWHKQFGKIYIICCMTSAAMGLFLALGKWGNPVASAGFSTLAVLWFFTTWFAYRCIRKRDFRGHRRWLIRSFSMTFAFFTVKFYNVFLIYYSSFDWPTQMALKSWIAWAPNLIIMEGYIRSTSHQGKWMGFLSEFKTKKKSPPPRASSDH